VPGQRLESLKAAAAAAKLQPSIELRNEAVAALALLDLEDWHWRAPPGFSDGTFAVDPALERYAMGNRQGEITIYRTSDGAELMRFVGSKSAARYLQFSPDGRFLVATFASTRLVLWNLTTRTPVLNAKFGVIRWGPHSVFTADGAKVGIRVPEPRIAFFDLNTGAELESLPLSAPAQVVALRPDGQVLAVAAIDGTDVELWDLKSRKLHRKLAHEVPVEGLSWHADGRHLAVGGWRGHLYLWDTESTNRLELHGHTGLIPNVLFNHRGTILVSGSWDGTTRFWDVGTGKQLLMSFSGSGVGFSPDDQRLAFLREGVGLGIWRVHGSTCFRTFAHPLGSTKPVPATADLSTDGHWLLSGSREAVHVWDFASQRLVYSERVRNGYSAYFAPNGQSFITIGFNEVRQWPLIKDEDESTFAVGQPRTLMRLPPNTDPHVTVTRGERHTITVSHAKGVAAFDLDNPEPLPLIESKSLNEWAATTSDTNWLAISHQNGTEIWDLRRHEMVCSLVERGRLSFSPDGRWLVVASGMGYGFYETGSWRRRHGIQMPYQLHVATVAFSRDGRLAALASPGRLVQIVDPATGREIVTLSSPHSEIVAWLAFSPDDRMLLVADDQKQIQAWDLRALRQELAALNLDWK
jgi:WD40 repeat protein